MNGWATHGIGALYGSRLVMGGTLPPGCAVTQGVLLIAMGIAFVVWYNSR